MTICKRVYPHVEKDFGVVMRDGVLPFFESAYRVVCMPSVSSFCDAFAVCELRDKVAMRNGLGRLPGIPLFSARP